MAELEDHREDIPADSAFHPDNVQQYILLTLLQIRDMLGMQLNLSSRTTGNSELVGQVDALEALHESGQLLLDLPYLAPPAEDGSTVT